MVFSCWPRRSGAVVQLLTLAVFEMQHLPAHSLHIKTVSQLHSLSFLSFTTTSLVHVYHPSTTASLNLRQKQPSLFLQIDTARCDPMDIVKW